MIESVFWYTGVWAWIVILTVAVMSMPVIFFFLTGYSSYVVLHWVNNRYYEDVDAVEQAEADGAWHYYVGETARRIRDYSVAGVRRYLKAVESYVLEPVGGRLP